MATYILQLVGKQTSSLLIYSFSKGWLFHTHNMEEKGHRLNFGPKITNFGPEITNFGPEIQILTQFYDDKQPLATL